MPFSATPRDVSAALRDHAEDVAERLLGKPSSRKSYELRFGTYGSVVVSLTGDKRGLYYNHENSRGGDLLQAIRDVRNVNFSEAMRIAQSEFLNDNVPRAQVTHPRKRSSGPDRGRTDNFPRAMRYWAEAAPLNGTMGEQYFAQHRGLDVKRLGDISHSLRFHIGARAVLGLMTDPISNEPVGVHATFFYPDGRKCERRMLGGQGVIRLTPDENVTLRLIITEGIEDGLTILLSGASPVWAMTCTGVMTKLPILNGIEGLTIVQDTDKAGMKAAKTCAEHWHRGGCEVLIVDPRKEIK